MTSLMFTFFPKMGNISNILRKNVVYKKDVDTFASIVIVFRYNWKKLCAQKSRGHFCIK